MTIDKLIEKFSNENGFQFGLDIVMESLRPNALYEISCANGEFSITRWDDSNELPMPSSQEIRDEYIRHKTIKEFLNYINECKDIRSVA